jgi:hypothetical protein
MASALDSSPPTIQMAQQNSSLARERDGTTQRTLSELDHGGGSTIRRFF